MTAFGWKRWQGQNGKKYSDICGNVIVQIMLGKPRAFTGCEAIIKAVMYCL